MQYFFSLDSNAIYFICIYPLAVLSYSGPRFAYTTSSVAMGMRGAKASISGGPIFLHLVSWLASCCFTSEYLYCRISCTRSHTAVRQIIYLARIYTYRVLLPLLLMLWTSIVAEAAAAVGRGAPYGKKIVPGSLSLI